MHKVAKLTTAAMFGALVMGAASGCGAKYDLLLWTGFGSSYSSAVQSLIDRYEEASGVKIGHESQGSYDKLQTNMNNSISTGAYPNIANGYPDHFAGYIRSSIQLPLDPYIKAYNDAHPGEDLLSDYYDSYLKEVRSLRYNADGSPLTMGLPFNKSTEVMGYNAYFLDYAMAKDPTITKIPDTWDEWKVVGAKMLTLMDDLYGKYLYGKVSADDSDKFTEYQISTSEEAPEGFDLVLDFHLVTKEKFRLMCWDATDNMFITIVRQWGGEYTSYSAEDAKTVQHGWAEFYSGESKDKTLSALNFFKGLYDDGIFGLASDISDDSYSSTGFKNNQCMFTICSSGGLSYNIGTFRFKLHAIPYKDADHKYVISQGTNLALFDQGSDEDKQKSFDAIVSLTRGALQGSWAVETGYYPASKSATATEAYQALLTQPQANPTKRAYQESAILNESTYMKDEEKWDKFVDPGFVGSSSIRQEVKTIMSIVFGGERTPDEILTESYTRISDYVRK